jgi:FlaA1/EpsC-like NDP-sugar epimerase
VFLAFYLRIGDLSFLSQASEYSFFICTFIYLLIWASVFYYFNFYNQIIRFFSSAYLINIFLAALVYLIASVCIFLVIGVKGVPKTIAFIEPVLFFLIVYSSRIFAGKLLKNKNDKKLTKITPKAMIYGAGLQGIRLYRELKDTNEIHIVGFIDDSPEFHNRKLLDLNVFDSKNLKKTFTDYQVSEVYLAIPSLPHSERSVILENLQKANVHVKTTPNNNKNKILFSDLEDIDMNDLLGRDPVKPIKKLLQQNTTSKVILVTGAGGSIGSELCKQILLQNPKKLILFEINEFALYNIERELKDKFPKVKIISILGSVLDSNRVRGVIGRFKPFIIYHSAAYKHVSLVEKNCNEGIKNNVFGTLTVAEAAFILKVPYFVLISTDKAVRPSSVMGASKRLSEIILLSFFSKSKKTIFTMVRFGNVLGSSGSVVPLFRKQIASGGPITLTHRDATRFFMSIPEASQLVIQAASLAKSGDIFLLDMGKPVKILDLARRIVELNGLTVKDKSNPYGNIPIKILGLKKGEKLFEELLISGKSSPTSHPGIMKANEPFKFPISLKRKVKMLHSVIAENNDVKSKAILKSILANF